MKRKILIQGIEGCFHDAAAREFFERHHPEMEIETVACETFPEMMARMDAAPSMLSVMAVENTIAGALLPNMELLRKGRCSVIGEWKMRISHSLCALPGQTIEDIKEVNSHPMALMQCEEYLLKHPEMRMVEKFDTAGAARQIATEGLKGHAAVCGEFAAKLYGLDILERGIETNKHNFTRFLILAHDDGDAPAGATEMPDKASMVFTLPHSQGSLAKVLVILAIYDINLTNIQSIPIAGHEWEYRFYVDLTYKDYRRYRQALDAVTPCVSDLRILGEYRHCQGISGCDATTETEDR